MRIKLIVVNCHLPDVIAIQLRVDQSKQPQIGKYLFEVRQNAFESALQSNYALLSLNNHVPSCGSIFRLVMCGPASTGSRAMST